MNDPLREKNMPVFVFLSMCFHALLFLYAPQLIAGLVPTFQSGDQGGLTYVTLVDITPLESPQATINAEARAPQSTAQPAPAPTPAPPADSATETPVEPVPPPERQPVELRPQPTPAPEPRVQLTAEQPQEVTPVREVVTAEPLVAPAPDEILAERPSADANILVAERGAPIAPASTVAPAQIADVPTPARRAESVPSPATQVSALPEVEERPAPAQSEAGTAQTENVVAQAPDTQLSHEPVMPPTGTSMTSTQGGLIYPKEAVDFLRQNVTVEVATIVNEAGEVIEVVVVQPSGISAVDNHAVDLASRGITYSPHDATYELRVHVTYNHDERSLSYRVGEFIQSPPTIGAHAL